MRTELATGFGPQAMKRVAQVNQQMKTTAIVISGLPASGKTTVGKLISSELMYPLLDRDVFLERLFDEPAMRVQTSRKIHSRMSDNQFREAAMIKSEVVLVSHWRPIGNSGDSGTPTEWLRSRFQKIIEIHCECHLATAANRFQNRKRHAGHLDERKGLEEIKS